MLLERLHVVEILVVESGDRVFYGVLDFTEVDTHTLWPDPVFLHANREPDTPVVSMQPLTEVHAGKGVRGGECGFC